MLGPVDVVKGAGQIGFPFLPLRIAMVQDRVETHIAQGEPAQLGPACLGPLGISLGQRRGEPALRRMGIDDQNRGHRLVLVFRMCHLVQEDIDMGAQPLPQPVGHALRARAGTGARGPCTLVHRAHGLVHGAQHLGHANI